MNWPALSAAWLAGLFGSVHCLAMCGGIAVALAAAPNANKSAWAAWSQAAQLNLSRVLGYAIAGALVGLIGGSFLHAFQDQTWTRYVRLAVGAVMIIVALRLLDVGGRWRWLSAPGQWVWALLSRLQRALQFLPLRLRLSVSGLLWSFLPCGLSSTLLLAAWFEADVWRGALLMAVFGLGTLPAMVLVSYSGQRSMQWLQQPTVRLFAALWIGLVGLLSLTAPWIAGLHPALPGALAAMGCVVR